MSLRKSAPPVEYTRAHIAGLGDFIDPSTSLGSLLLHNSEAYAVHNLVLKKIVEAGPTVPLATLTQEGGMRFMAGDLSQSGASHVGSTKQGVAPTVTGFSDEPEVGDAIDALRAVGAMPEAGAADFQLRILRVPWLRFEAFWLHSANGQEDLVVPYSGFPRIARLTTMTPYPASEFLNAIRKLLPRPNLPDPQPQVSSDLNPKKKGRPYQRARGAGA